MLLRAKIINTHQQSNYFLFCNNIVYFKHKILAFYGNPLLLPLFAIGQKQCVKRSSFYLTIPQTQFAVSQGWQLSPTSTFQPDVVIYSKPILGDSEIALSGMTGKEVILFYGESKVKRQFISTKSLVFELFPYFCNDQQKIEIMKRTLLLFAIISATLIGFGQSVSIGDILCVNGNDTIIVHPYDYSMLTKLANTDGCFTLKSKPHRFIGHTSVNSLGASPNGTRYAKPSTTLMAMTTQGSCVQPHKMTIQNIQVLGLSIMNMAGIGPQ